MSVSGIIDYPSMLMVGSAGRNAGKTELACALLQRFARVRDVIGVKVTAIDEMSGKCPRGGEGCGVCTSLEGPFCITDETCGPPGKDTTRMLEAGAARVLWLRCLKSHLERSARALIDAIGPDTVCVCESNSLRQMLKPGVFAIVKNRDSHGFKASAEDVLEFADRVVLSDGERFDLSLDRIELIGNRWALVEDATAIILAGGKSGRMGREKCLLPIGGRPMVQHIAQQLVPHFDEVIVSANDPRRYKFLKLPVVPDVAPGMGPLGGIFSSLLASSSDRNVVVACDIPEMNLPLLRRMVSLLDGCDAVIPRRGEGMFEPLFAAYDKSVIPAMRSVLGRGCRKISDIFDHTRVHYLELMDAFELKNLNTMKDYEDYVEQHDNS